MNNSKIYINVINQNGEVVDLVNFLVQGHNNLINDSVFKERKGCILSDGSGIVVEFYYIDEEVENNG